MAKVIDELVTSVGSMGVKRSYGDPVSVGGVEIVPVALVGFGFGGGSDEGDSSAGVGGGGNSIPIGAYVPGPDGPLFKPNLIALLAVSIPVICVTGKALSRVIRALKK